MLTRPIHCNCLLVVLFLFSALLLGCNPNTGGPPPAFAADPVVLPLLATDPQGTPVAVPAGAPPLWTTVLKFQIPSGTIFDLSVDGWILRNTTQGGNDGGYAVLAQNSDGAGHTTWIVQAWPPVPDRFFNKLTYRIVDVSLNTSATGTQLASKADNGRVFVQAGVNPDLNAPNPFATPGTPEWASINGTDFLSFPTIRVKSEADVGAQAEADAYYKLVDPGDGDHPSGLRLTLTDWKRVNGFGPDDSQDDAKALYFNAGDLGLGRSMHMKVKPNGDIAYYVSNYPTVEDALRKTNLIATVAMEYTLNEQTGQGRIMKFFVFDNNDQRVGFADLDGNGKKYLPNLCVICHGHTSFSSTAASADLGARFLPFDLSSYQYSASLGRNAQESDFKKLNQGILQSNKSVAEANLIAEWYTDPNGPNGNSDSPVQRSDAVPPQWGGPPNLYLDVIKLGCRSCHIIQDGLDFATLANFQSRTLNPQSAQSAQFRVCDQRSMPNAIVTYQRFWLMQRLGSAHYAVRVLNDSLGDPLTNPYPFSPCPNPAP
jgi:hypothetical protein